MKRITRPVRPAALAAAAALALAAGAPFARADLTGFDTFAPANTYQDASNVGPSGDGIINANLLQLTTGGNSGQATSAFSTTPQNITNFVARFTYYPQYSGNAAADGMTFTVHNDPAGTAAIGAPGGGLGYASDANHPGIANSAAFGLNLYSGYYSGNAIGTWSYGTNGSITHGQPYFNNFGLLYDNAPYDVTVSYSGGSISTTLRDQNTGAVNTFLSAAVNIAQAVGGSTALVGFTGATGGITSTQYVSNFTYTTVKAPTGNTYAPIAVAGYNQDAIVEAGAASFQTAVTATMDNGTARDDTGNLSGATWYETGFNTAAPTTGLPAGKTFTGADASHSFAVASATANNVVLLNSASTSGTLTLTSPATYAALSFLTSTGNGSGSFDVVIHHAGGAADETISNIGSSDWFFNIGALQANGRVNPDLSTDSVNSGNPQLYQFDVPLTDTTDPITSIDLNYDSGSGNTMIFGVSGVSATATPEPSALALLSLGGLAMMRRHRRRGLRCAPATCD